MSLALRSLFWTIVFPGAVAGFIPWRYLGLQGILVDLSSPLHLLALACIVCGALALGACIVEFARSGHGTLAPMDPPTQLVVRGLYRYVRNPMYVGVAMILAGECALVASRGIIIYAVAWFGIVNGFVLVYEEPRLRQQFGASYDEYCRQTGRWIPSTLPQARS